MSKRFATLFAAGMLAMGVSLYADQPAAHKKAMEGVAIFPRVQDLAIGSNIVYTAKATFAQPLKYQWRFNGADLRGTRRRGAAPIANMAAQHQQPRELVRCERPGLIRGWLGLAGRIDNRRLGGAGSAHRGHPPSP